MFTNADTRSHTASQLGQANRMLWIYFMNLQVHNFHVKYSLRACPASGLRWIRHPPPNTVARPLRADRNKQKKLFWHSAAASPALESASVSCFSVVRSTIFDWIDRADHVCHVWGLYNALQSLAHSAWPSSLEETPSLGAVLVPCHTWLHKGADSTHCPNS